MKIIIHNLNDLEILAGQISKVLVPSFIIVLNGDLGAGKTTFVRSILKAMGVQGSIKSPTYTLVEEYNINDIALKHFDLYRFNEPDEWFDCGFNEYFTGNNICFIEWPSKADGLIANIDWNIEIQVINDYRIIEITALTTKGHACLTELIIPDVVLSS